MSFKRDGDDTALLRNLKMRRVGELLGDHIPDDEAGLLSNGRLYCMICSHRPVFDTITTLAVHRKGKKHINELSLFLAHKRELEVKQQKTDHHKYLEVEKGLSSSNRIPGKKSKSDPSRLYCRKPVLDVPKLGNNELNQRGIPSAQSQVRQYLKSLWKKQALEKTVEKLRENYGESMQTHKVEDEQKPKTSEQVPVKTEITTAVPVKDKLRESTRKDAEYHLQLRMSGWIKDPDGNWTKDPNVEFDSDEDEPAGAPS